MSKQTSEDMFYNDDWPEPPAYMEEPPEDPVHQKKRYSYAASLVGKWVTIKPKGLPHLGTNYLAKVVRQGDRTRGGNLGQVLVNEYIRNEMWSLRLWKLVTTSTPPLECYDSHWMVTTDRRPSTKDTLNQVAYVICRRVVHHTLREWYFISNYSQWRHRFDSRYLTPIAFLYGAFVYDLIYGLKHGVGK